MASTTTTAGRQIADELLAALAAIRRAGRRHSARPVELSSLTGAQLELARLVHRQRGTSVAAAAEELRLAPNTVSTLVCELASAGLLTRRTDPADRRVAQLELSPSLDRKIGVWRDRRATSLATAIERLSEPDRRRLEAALPVLAHLADELDVVGAGQ